MTGRTRIEPRSLSPVPNLDLAAVGAGVVATFLLTVLVSAVLAVLIYVTNLTEAHVSGVLFYTGLVAIALGGAVSSRRAGTLGWLHGGLAGLVYVLLSVVLGALLFPGSQALGQVVGKIALGGVCGAAGGVAGINAFNT